MFVVNDDLSIYATRGDIVCLNVSATDDRSGLPYEFQPGDIVQMKIYTKKNAENVVLQKDFPVVAKTDTVGVVLTEQDTKIGEVISKPTDYWYEVTLNPYSNPQTFIGYDDDGAKIFKLFPEGNDIEDEPTKPEDIPVVDADLSLSSSRPVENKAIARALTLLKNDLTAAEARLNGKIKENEDVIDDIAEQVAENKASIEQEVAVERARIDNLVASPTPGDSELVDIRVGADGNTYGSAGTAVREQFADTTAKLNAVADVEDNKVSLDFTTYKRTDSYTGPVVEATEKTLTIRANSYNTDIMVGFSTVAGHRYSVAVDASGLTSDFRFIRIQNTESTASGNMAAELTDVEGAYQCVFTAVSEASFLYLSVQYDNANAVVLSNAQIEDLTIGTSLTIKGEKLRSKSVPLSALETTKLSAFENDVDVGVKYRKRRNLLNRSAMQRDVVINTANGEIATANGYETTDFIPVAKGDKVFAAAQKKSSTGTWVYRDMIFRYAFFDADKTYVSGGQNGNYSSAETPASIDAPLDGYIRFSSWNIEDGALAYVTTEALSQSAWGDYAFEPYRETDIPISDPDWYGATIMSFGDSITAIGNGDSNCVGWQKYVCDYFGIAKHYGRGIGASTMTYRSATWYANADGSYNSRDDGGNPPHGTTEHLSSFCAWDRITTMIPDSIKDSIDMIFVMGGTNDFISNQPIGDKPVWDSKNTTDAMWKGAIEYNGGDFDITTFSGAVASTIMKLQKRCPNAVVVVGTPISGYGTKENAEKNSRSLTVEDYAGAIADVAHMMSVPCVDVFGATGINQFNYAGKITDGTHPYSVEGCKCLGRAVIGGMKTVARILE